MSHNKTKVNSIVPDGSGNISITTDDVPETGSNEYYTPARIDAKIAATSVGAFVDVSTAGAVAGDALVLSAGVWTPAGVSAAVEVSFIGAGVAQAYPWSGAVLTPNEPYSNGKQIEFFGLNQGTGLGTVKYDVRNTGTTNGTSAWTVTDSVSYVAAGWVRATSFLPAGSYLVYAGVGLVMPASTSYLDFQIFKDGAAYSSTCRVGGDTSYPRIACSLVTFGSAPVNPGDNQIDVRVSGSSGDLTAQGNVQAERGFIQILKVAT